MSCATKLKADQLTLPQRLLCTVHVLFLVNYLGNWIQLQTR